jgi:hypothetical protein
MEVCKLCKHCKEKRPFSLTASVSTFPTSFALCSDSPCEASSPPHALAFHSTFHSLRGFHRRASAAPSAADDVTVS